jgi:ABC-type transporter MlaC component
MKRQVASLIFLIFFLYSFSVYAGEPMNVAQVNVNKVLEILRDPKLKAESAKETKKTKITCYLQKYVQ